MASIQKNRPDAKLIRPQGPAPEAPVANAGAVAIRAAAPAPGTAAGEQPRAYWLAAAVAVTAVGALMYWRTLGDLIGVWNAEQDYSHGFLVPPFAAIMLWMRKNSFPASSAVPGWGGLVLLASAIAMRYAGLRLFLTPLGGWSLVLWLAGAVWLLAGRRTFVWAAPALLFLMFMVPLPFRVEQMLSWHLQTITTTVSSVILECLGQPAVAEGHTVYLGEQVLEVEQACSGLRMFMGIAAVAFALAVLQGRPWWENLVLAVSVAPVAMLANSLRVVITGLLLTVVHTEAAKKIVHDAAGWVMIVIATVMFTMVATYVRRLVVTVEIDSGRDLLRRPVAT
jgi:exosortase